jgi:hypothetical protein
MYHAGVCVCVQVAEENGLEVMTQLEANPVSRQNPAETSGAAGLQTLTNEEEDKLSSRYDGNRGGGG